MEDLATLRKLNKAFVPCAVLGLIALATTPFSGQSPVQQPLAGVPYDWSHHHLIYSAPSSRAQAAKLQQEPRYWHQWFHRNAALVRPHEPFPKRPSPSNEGIWGESLPGSSAAGTVGQGNYPAKYSFNGALSCSDYVVFNTSLTGGAGSASVTFTNVTGGDTSGSVTITNASTGASLTLSASTTTSGTNWANNSSTGSTDAIAFNTALNTAGNGSSVGVYSTVSGATVTVTASQLGAVTISIKNTNVSNISTPSSPNSESLTGGTNAARVLAYKDLYAGSSPGCGTIGSGVPTLSWQYETGGVVKTSISLSEDGTQLAFVQSYNTSSTTTAAELVLLTPGTSSTLAIPTLETAANYPNCTRAMHDRVPAHERRHQLVAFRRLYRKQPVCRRQCRRTPRILGRIQGGHACNLIRLASHCKW